RIVERLEALAPERVTEVASGAQGPWRAFRSLGPDGRNRNDPAGRQVPDHVERLAHHALRGEVWDKAVACCQQAGARAYDRAAFREAVAYYEQALQALDHLPESGATRVLAIELRLALGGPLNALGAYGRSLARFGEAEPLARALDDQVQLGRVLARLGQARRITGDLDGAVAAGRQALDLATTLG